MSGEAFMLSGYKRAAPPQNEKRERWYGLRPGDLVEERAFGRVTRNLTVTMLHPTDNNGCTVEDRRGRRRKAVCEWLDIVRKVEDRT